MTAFSRYDEYDLTKRSVTTWLSRIAHNKATDLLRSGDYKSRNPLPENEEEGTEDAGIQGMVDINETADLILSRLDIKEREFLNLRYGLQLSDKEIGDMLGEKENTISKRYQRLLKKCRDIANG